MGQRELRGQKQLIKTAIESTDNSTLRLALEGTIGDTRSFCWATQRQFKRYYEEVTTLASAQDYGLHHAEKHMLIVVAQDTVLHVKGVERLLDAIGEPRALPPDRRIRDQLRQARNLLCAHRDERVLYRRLTGKHTPHVVDVYRRLGLELPDKSIDTEIVAFSPPPGATSEETKAGYSLVGMLGGGLLSLRELGYAFAQLEADLDELAKRCRSTTS